jgi:FSR family fosmidomycin resistance protein-like MFS transporter
MMGFAFGLGGIASPLVGKLADIHSVRTVLTWISFVPLITLFLIARFPATNR